MQGAEVKVHPVRRPEYLLLNGSYVMRVLVKDPDGNEVKVVYPDINCDIEPQTEEWRQNSKVYDNLNPLPCSVDGSSATPGPETRGCLILHENGERVASAE